MAVRMEVSSRDPRHGGRSICRIAAGGLEAQKFEHQPGHALRPLSNHEVTRPLDGRHAGVRYERQDLSLLVGPPSAAFPAHEQCRSADSFELRLELGAVLARVFDQSREDCRVEARLPSAPLVLPVSALDDLVGDGWVERVQCLARLLKTGVRVWMGGLGGRAVAKWTLVWCGGIE